MADIPSLMLFREIQARYLIAYCHRIAFVRNPEVMVQRGTRKGRWHAENRQLIAEWELCLQVALD